MRESQSPSYLIYGAGALGSVFGGFLQKIGRQVVYAGRGNHFSAIQNNGLQITGIWGNYFVTPERIELLTNNCSKKFSIVLLCVKSKDTRKATSRAQHFLRNDGIMVSIQNGLDNWEAICKVVGKERTVGARVIFGAEILAPGLANVTVNADDVLLGEPFAQTNHHLLKILGADLNKSGIPSRIVTKDEIWGAIWGKVLYNCALNPLSALLEVPYGKLGENGSTRNIIRIVLEEIFQVMEAKGINVPYQSTEEYYNFLMEKQLPATLGHRASMLQDIMNGKKTEIDALNGAISRHAAELKIPTPYNDLLTALIKFKENRANERFAHENYIHK